MTRVELLTTADEDEVLDFELRNREFFAATVGDRGEDQHRARVDENEKGHVAAVPDPTLHYERSLP